MLWLHFVDSWYSCSLIRYCLYTAMSKKQSQCIPSGFEWLKEIFTDEEINSLTAYYSYETGVFDCIGFANSAGKVSQFAEPAKAQAIAQLEDIVRQELKYEQELPRLGEILK